MKVSLKVVAMIISIALMALAVFGYTWKKDQAVAYMAFKAAAEQPKAPFEMPEQKAAVSNARVLAERVYGSRADVGDLKIDVVETYVNLDCPTGRGWAEVIATLTQDGKSMRTRAWCQINDEYGECRTQEELAGMYPPEWFDAVQAKALGGQFVCDRSLAPIKMMLW
jgi:hypothetical protein